MAGKSIDLITYLETKGLYVNSLEYECSQVEFMTPETTTNIFSRACRRLSQTEMEFQLYDNDGEYYLYDESFYDLYEKVIALRKNEALEKHDWYEFYDAGMISDSVRSLNKKGLSIWGNKQCDLDSWEVLDDVLLNDAEIKAQVTGKQQLFVFSDTTGETYLVNRDHEKVLVKRTKDLGLYDHGWGNFFEIRNQDGDVILPDIPDNKLGLVTLAMEVGISMDQIKTMFLWPDLSVDMIADSQLIFERNIRSKNHEIKSLADMKALDELEPISDNEHVVSKYRFCGNKICWYSELAFSADDLPEVFNSLYHDNRVDTKAAAKYLSDFFLKVADDLDISILRQERRLHSIREVTELQILDDGQARVVATPKEHGIEKRGINFVKSVFTVLDKESEEPIKEDLTLDELWSVLSSIDPKES